LKWHLIDAWVGTDGTEVEVEQNFIDDDIDQWRRRLHACIRDTRHFEYTLFIS